MPKPNQHTRIRIVQDSDPADPRKDMDMVCEIEGDHHWRGSDIEDRLVDLIQRTDAYGAAMAIIDAAGPTDEERDAAEPDLWNKSVRITWLELLADTELKTREFSTQGRSFVAYTTPKMCADLGVDWSDAARVMDGEIEMYSQWANGDVYGYVIEEWNPACDCDHCSAGEYAEVESCWGFYGSDPFTNGMSEHVLEELHEQLRAAEVEYGS